LFFLDDRILLWVFRNQDYIKQYTMRHAITVSNVAGPKVLNNLIVSCKKKNVSCSSGDPMHVDARWSAGGRFLVVRKRDQVDSIRIFCSNGCVAFAFPREPSVPHAGIGSNTVASTWGARNRPSWVPQRSRERIGNSAGSPQRLEEGTAADNKSGIQLISHIKLNNIYQPLSY